MTLQQTKPKPTDNPIDLKAIKQYASHHTRKGESDKVLTRFIDNYYQNIQQHFGRSTESHVTEENLAGIAVYHFSLLQRYQYMTPQVEVFNPNYETVHFHSPHSVIQIVAADRPFLIDTLLMSLDSMNIAVHRLHNTIMSVARDEANHITEVSTATTSDTKFISLIYCEMSRQSVETLSAIRQAIFEKVNVLDLVVKDWEPMRDKLFAVKQELTNSKLPAIQDTHSNHTNINEIQAFLDWILHENFIFLGYREYRYSDQASGSEIYHQPDSGLGLLTDNSNDANKRSDSFHQLPKSLRALIHKPQILLLSKSSHLSPVHRPVYMDFLGIQKFDKAGKVTGEHRFIGLLTANAYQLSAGQIPMLRQKVSSVLTKAQLPANGHAYHKFQHILNTLPRDDLFQATTNELYQMSVGIANLLNKHELKLFVRIDPYQRFVSCLVYVPRDKFNTYLRMAMQSALMEAFGGISAQFSTQFNELHHARLHIHVRTKPESLNNIDFDALLPNLENQMSNLMQGWQDNAAQIFIDELGEVTGRALADKYLLTIPLAYQEDYAPRIALSDIRNLDQIVKQTDKKISWHLYQKANEPSQNLHLKVYGKNSPATLSHILPILENFGWNILNSQTYEFDEHALWLQEYHLSLRQDANIDIAVVDSQVEEALDLIWQGTIENDNLNELIVTTPLNAFEVVVLRALSHYMLQAKAPFSLSYIKQALVKYPQISILLVQLFHAKMHPQDIVIDSCIMSADITVDEVTNQIQTALKTVQTLDEDSILRWMVDLINAMLRTNYYQRDDYNQPKNRLAFKFSAKDIPHLPKPKPMFEIFVYSPNVEAVHLRGGKVARGGLRWSDRKEDFRTEVLGLVKAQMVKNAVIVPVGSKGGFIVKRETIKAGRDAFMAEGIACYQTFIRGMLDITDNLVDGQIIPPANTVRHDGDDPYLVVAADKGTASFSDIANAISAEYGFWLGDAFASGGSVGYDHKAMGITARGAWESVKRHFRLLGKDIQNSNDATNQISVLAIGDMSGDVFGNGMLLSPNIQLRAAFNHLHIFIDPNPMDIAAAFAERHRLFTLPRSTWEDYDKSLISQGGGIFSRQDKAIIITQPMKDAFAITADSLTPDELIHALLMAPVDLIWNGGIGTYIKSGAETNIEVGDRANDAVRINGNQVQAKVIGEGGNLGMTQRGRIEYAQKGGRLYTDAIDNSAGVNCSDHEVNIKILLDHIVEQGDMTTKQRNDLLASMTDRVANLVLRQNYLQPQAIELSAKRGVENLALQQKFMQFLEGEERLDRAIEFLPTDEQLSVRQQAAQGLTNPELAVIMAYGKMWMYDNVLASDLPDDSYFTRELHAYFPKNLSEKYFEQMTLHPLHREIISTYLTNSIVNRLGIELIYQLTDELGVSVAAIVRAYSVVRDVFNLRQHWQMIESLDNQIDANKQLEMELNLRQDMTQSMYWIIHQFGERFTVDELTQKLMTGVQALAGQTAESQPSTSYFANYLHQLNTEQNLSELLKDLHQRFAIQPLSPQILDAIWFAEKKQQPADNVSVIYFKAYKTLGIDGLLAQTQVLPQDSYWEHRAVQALRGDIMTTFRHYVGDFLAENQPLYALDKFALTHKVLLDEIKAMHLSDKPVSFAKLSVLLSELKMLSMPSINFDS